MQTDHRQISTLGQLKAGQYQPRLIKDELRNNLIRRLKAGENPFPGILGYEDTVIPDLQRAILARHNILLLGLRGQAKTRIARLLVNLLDEWVPYIAGTDLADDPFHPLSAEGREILAQEGDNTPITWLHRSERYAEKLATPDVTVADLIGDVDPIKAANLRLSYADERVIHFGIIPRSNRGIFVINELPDLQPRIQVALFNILQEGDIQIRGFKLRLPLDVQFVFTANPEDYTNRGSIVTPLKDRIESQILTHYPKSIDISRKITEQEAVLADEQKQIVVPDVMRDLVEEIAVAARDSEYVDQNSGVSARLTISAFENLVSQAELRALKNHEKDVFVRLGDFTGVIPAITGKIELVYEGEQEGPAIVAQNLIAKAIRKQFSSLFPDPETLKREKKGSPYQEIVRWFGSGNEVEMPAFASAKDYKMALTQVPGLESLVKFYHPDADGNDLLLLMEFVLHGMAEYSLIGRSKLGSEIRFSDLLSGMFNPGTDLDFDDEDENFDDEY